MKLVAVALFLLLLLSNGVWAYLALDQGVTMSYHQDQHNSVQTAFDELKAITPKITTLKQVEMLEVLENSTESELFFKNGCHWEGHLGFRFDSETGALLSVSPSWNFGEPDPCYKTDL